MVNKLVFIGLASLLFCGQSAVAESIASIPPSGSHFRISVTGAALNITTVTPNRLYPNAGIQVLTPGFQVSGNVRPTNDGFYLFSVSDTVPAKITLAGAGGTVQIKICLNGVGKKYSCENQTVSSLASSHIIFVTSTAYSGNLGGTAGADGICQSVAYQSGSIIPNPGLKFKALLVTSGRYPCSSNNGGISGSCGGSFAKNWPLVPNTDYVASDGETPFNTVNANGVFDGSNPIINDERGIYTFNQIFWIGVQSILSNASSQDIVGWAYSDMNIAADGLQYQHYLATCHDFTVADSSVIGSYGSNGQVASGSGSIPGNTWGNYFFFDNGGTTFLENVFNFSQNSACNLPLSLICVS
jgi:hypothetical protein